jgi:uncharacterized ion transporter superfamily protein YfcC
MSKKKSVICTILFAIIFIGILTCTFFIKSYSGSFSLFTLISAFVTGRWTADCIKKFYKWISK